MHTLLLFASQGMKASRAVTASVVPLGWPGGFGGPVRGVVEALVPGGNADKTAFPGRWPPIRDPASVGMRGGRWLPDGPTWRIRRGR